MTLKNFSKYGHWICENIRFHKKIDALSYASKEKKMVKFYYHDHVWNSFDRTLLGKIRLNELYKLRAQQLRDSYDYLVLYYSGGADSHNILKTFIDNNIKLDEICVKWPKMMIDGNMYTPNTEDTSSRNYWSEWNFAIKPTLDLIKSYFPNIKITIKDYTENIQKINFDQVFQNLNFVRGGGILLNSVISDSDIFYADSSKKICHIYGIDKPLLFEHDNKMYMFFSDVCLDQAGKSTINGESTECFYWTPDLPLLAFEMAYQLTMHLKNKPREGFVWTTESFKKKIKTQITQNLNNISRNVLYTTWNNRFQADKPNASRTDKFFWFYEHPELISIRERYLFELNERIKNISEDLLTGESTFRSYEICITRFFYITDINR